VEKIIPAHARSILKDNEPNELTDVNNSRNLLSWSLTLFVTFIGAALRWPRLSVPNAVVFDETYYVKDAYAILKNGYERTAVANADKLLLEGRNDLFETTGSFVAHPPVGKWVIALGEQIGGLNSFGWRIGVAVMGTLLILVTTRVAIRLLRSIWFGVLAGFLIAIDGLAIVMSRTALLDGIMTTFMLMGFACILIDRDYSRNRISHNLIPESIYGGRWTWHPWRIPAGIFFGLAIGTKCNALWLLALAGVLTLIWDRTFRKIRKAKKPTLGVLFVDSWWASIQLLIPALSAYLLSWFGWFNSQDGWGRNPEQTGFINALKSLGNYHEQILNFHINLVTDHSYEAYALGWPILWRPTSFFYQENLPNCAGTNCAAEVLALGNPLIWWLAVLALIVLLINFLNTRNWRSGTIVALFLVGWAPWLVLPNRTMFYFYAIAFLPFMVMAIASVAKMIYDRIKSNKQNRNIFNVTGLVLLVSSVVLTAYFYPVWTAITIPKNEWLMRMWFSKWI
jgi:dolichyl-phosphate-mannose--protein O-mannosyl transferase